MVIVSEYGKHDKASRRVVRAQAARASAPQSRLTRARNREDRLSQESAVRLRPSPQLQDQTHDDKPLSIWLTSIPIAANPVLQTRHRQLPIVTPRGFIALAQSGHLDEQAIAVVSHVACFDFLSAGIEYRLQNACADMVQAINQHHAAQHVLIACLCITLYQAQQIRSEEVSDAFCGRGLIAASIEAQALSDAWLLDTRHHDASIWTIMMICATMRNEVLWSRYGNVLRSLLPDPGEHVWTHTRNILLDYIFPGTLVEAACRTLLQTMLLE